MDDISAPSPRDLENAKVVMGSPNEPAVVNTSGVSITVAGCGGAGINMARNFAHHVMLDQVINYDTSDVNIRAGEKVVIVANGSGSGSLRSANAREIERSVAQFTESDIGTSDVVIVMFSLSGGTGSVAAPVLMRHYARLGRRVIGVCIADASSEISAKNTKNSILSLVSIADKNDLELPLVMVSNDLARSRGVADTLVKNTVSDIIDILTSPVHEVDRNDRLNWISPTKVVGTGPGLRLMCVQNDQRMVTSEAVLGATSTEMVDSMLILQNTLEERPDDKTARIPARLKKVGFFIAKSSPRLVGRVTSDISSIDKILDQVTQMENAVKSHRNSTSSRLQAGLDSSDDLIL